VALVPLAMTAAGRHARGTARRLARRGLTALLVLVLAGTVAGLIAGFTSTVFVLAELAVIAGLLWLDRRTIPAMERWRRGASGEEHVGRILDGLARDGWLAIHDVNTGRGNIDHILVGPAGVLSIETKSHPGRIRVDAIDERMLKQAYAQSKQLERLIEHPVSPLLVFSRAYLDRPVSRRRGVVVLPARMLERHLARRDAILAHPEIMMLQAHVMAALGPTSGPAAS
jgi:hypothetical protein